MERVFYRTVRGDDLLTKPRGDVGWVLSFRQAVDTVVQQNHVQVDVAAVGMDEVVAADGGDPSPSPLTCHTVSSGLATLQPVAMAARRVNGVHA